MHFANLCSSVFPYVCMSNFFHCTPVHFQIFPLHTRKRTRTQKCALVTPLLAHTHAHMHVHGRSTSIFPVTPVFFWSSRDLSYQRLLQCLQRYRHANASREQDVDLYHWSAEQKSAMRTGTIPTDGRKNSLHISAITPIVKERKHKV